MIHIVSCMKLKDSYNRIMAELADKNVEWEEYISDLDQLQEKIVYSEYDLAIIDQKLWWEDEAVSLFTQKGVEIIEFTGDFDIIVNEITERVPNETEEEINFKDVDIGLEISNPISKNEETQPRYIIQEKVVEVEKVVYKSRNIKQQIFSVISTDNLTMRDSFSCNMAALLTSDKIIRTLLVDITNCNNLINHLDIYIFNKSEPFEIENFNANTIRECVSSVKGYDNLHLLNVSNKVLTKKNIKSILFSARDYDNIIFCIESDLNNLPVQFTLNLSHKVFLITDPIYLSAKNNLDIINSLLKKGQIEENISIILTGLEPLEKESIEYMYKGFKIAYLNRDKHLRQINKKKFVDDKKEEKSYLEILGVDNKGSKLFSKLFNK